jgi:hypothetical protein
MPKLYLIILSLWAFAARAEWRTMDTVLEVSFVTVTTIDWMQTINFTQHKPWYQKELNPILGERPSRARVNTLIPLAILGHAAVSVLLPKNLRTIWQGVTLGFEIITVSNNQIRGCSMSVPWD